MGSCCFTPEVDAHSEDVAELMQITDLPAPVPGVAVAQVTEEESGAMLVAFERTLEKFDASHAEVPNNANKT